MLIALKSASTTETASSFLEKYRKVDYECGTYGPMFTLIREDMDDVMYDQGDYWKLLTALRTSYATETEYCKNGDQSLSITDMEVADKNLYRNYYEKTSVQAMGRWANLMESVMLSKMPLKQRIIYSLPTITYKKSDSNIQITIELHNHGKKIMDNSMSL